MENVNTVSENGAAVAIEDLYTDDEKEIWEEILDYAIWEFCLDVHRTVKLNYFYLDPDLDPNYKPDERDLTYNGETDKDGQKSKKNNEYTAMDCPYCSRPSNVVGLGSHLPKCLGLGGRTRETNKKGTGDTEENEFEDVPSTSSGRSKGRRSKKRRNRKLQKSKAEAEYSPRPSSEMNDDLESMLYEEKDDSFKEECDGVTETNNSCSQNTNEESEAFETTHLRELDDVNDGEIIADTESNSEINPDSASSSESNANTANIDDSGYFDTT